ncbi:hypothetical protein [Neptunomonas qingdaonensis]|uniref:DUF1835 domain-containing protein n=1 Tax=Neptunomonas qingdaonensis TaxID=1045558 RepID=A0A1I2SCA9_9GAMM|nr:hypothetical protein [Neptunomonas qingdaonensis]SFG47706.1 hypothetical protein SAMN05216175_107109 [Neptunomonas qingdaonensis]
MQNKVINILNITNGDCAVEIMEKADIPGVFLPWRDVLHDGPVPADLTLEKLSQVRAQFIIDQGWGEPEHIKQHFIQRDKTLNSFEEYEKIILWFEHDLYDQLQILQILDWFNQNRRKETALSIICVDQYLGMLSPDEMSGLFEYEEAVTESHLRLASKAWAAFRSGSPEKWSALLKADTSALPFLEGAIIRMLEEYPSCVNGLSRTAQKALEIILQGEKRPGRIFGLSQATEDRRFLGDSSFWGILHEFLASSPALLKLPQGKELTLPMSPDQELSLTQAGKDVLSGKRNWLEIIEQDRWIGGVHLTPDNMWCWDSDSGSLVKSTSFI